MAATSPMVLQALWDRALVEEFGIRFSVDGKSTQSFINELYAWRKDADDPRYEAIIIFVPNDGKVYMAKKATELRD